MKIKNYFTEIFGISLCLFLLGFSEVIYGQDPEYKTDLNIRYYSSNANKDNYVRERCVLDVYYPKHADNFSTVVWFHGGSLKKGNKSFPKGLKDKNICIVAVNYRLHPKVNSPAYIQDAAAAVAWVFNNISEYGGDTSRIFISGHSAGGYLTSMIGLDKKWLNYHNVDANRIAGLIPLSGQTITHSTIREERGVLVKTPIIDEFAPLFHIREDSPPLLLITGDSELDIVGRYEENLYLYRLMLGVGHKEVKIYELDGYGHNIKEPAYKLILNEVKRITEKK